MQKCFTKHFCTQSWSSNVGEIDTSLYLDGSEDDEIESGKNTSWYYLNYLNCSIILYDLGLLLGLIQWFPNGVLWSSRECFMKQYRNIVCQNVCCDEASNYRVCHGFRLMKQDDYIELISTTFESSIIFRGSWGSIVNWLEPKIEPP